MFVTLRAFSERIGLGHHDALGVRAFKSGALVAFGCQFVGDGIQSRWLASQGTDWLNSVLVQGDLIRAC